MDAADEELSPATALAVYGTLRPGELNHFVVKQIPGRWVEATVRGYLYEITWGPAEGYPGVSLDDSGHLVPVSVLVSDELSKHIWQVDRFEGDGYERRSVPVLGLDGLSRLGVASIYEAKTQID